MKLPAPIAPMVGLLAICCSLSQAGVVDEFHRLQGRLDSSILDTYDGTASPQTGQSLNEAWQALKVDLADDDARSLVPSDFSFQTQEELAAKIGTSRGRLQQIAALER